MTVALEDQSRELQAQIADGAEYISEYNRVLSRWWEQERASCE